MTRARRPSARTPASRKPTGPIAARSASRPPSRAAPVDPVAIYREAAGFRRWHRLTLVAGLVLLDLSLGLRATGHQPAPLLGLLGLAAMGLFLGSVFIRHLRALYRIRLTRPEAITTDLRFVIGMMRAPFGAGDPNRTEVDRAILSLTIALGLALLPLLFAVGRATQ